MWVLRPMREVQDEKVKVLALAQKHVRYMLTTHIFVAEAMD